MNRMGQFIALPLLLGFGAAVTGDEQAVGCSAVDWCYTYTPAPEP